MTAKRELFLILVVTASAIFAAAYVYATSSPPRDGELRAARASAALPPSDDVFEQLEAIADDLGPVYRVDGCRNCHRDPAQPDGLAELVVPLATDATPLGLR